MPPKPLALTDDQLTTVMRIAAPLPPADRSKFLEDVALSLGVIPETRRWRRHAGLPLGAAKILEGARALAACGREISPLIGEGPY
jgi:hypothetical protein